jgi:hypothetical protein
LCKKKKNTKENIKSLRALQVQFADPWVGHEIHLVGMSSGFVIEKNKNSIKKTE